MEIRNLKTFLRVTEMKNFSRAAEDLGYSQSAVTIQIQQLERELGTKLFDRIGKNVNITQYGQEFIPYAQQVIYAALKAANFSKESHELRGCLRIGTMESIMNAIFPEVIPMYHKKFPQVTVTLSIEPADMLSEMIKKNEIDVAYVLDFQKYGTEWVKNIEQDVKIVIVANAKNHLAKKKKVAIEEVLKEDLILMKNADSYRNLFDTELAKRNLTANPFLELHSTSIAIELIENNNYVSILPEFAVHESIEKGRLRMLDVVDLEMHQWIQLVYHKNKLLTPQLQGLIELMTISQQKIMKTHS